jgi:Na+-translocating ferredoxin:NAD+ oxidoreductase subunit G
MNFRDIMKITLNLAVVYLVGGLIIALAHAWTSPIRYQNKVTAEEIALKSLLPEADRIEKLGDWKIHEKPAKYYVAKKGDKPIGYIVQSFGKGYSSYINTLVAVDRDFRVMKVKVLDQKETPGLGDAVVEDSFIDRLRGKDSDHLKVFKTETAEYVQAITGATISSRAVTEDAVRSGVNFIRDRIKGGGSGNVGPK